MSPKPLMSWAVKRKETLEGVMDSKKECSHRHYLPGYPQVLGVLVGERRQRREKLFRLLLGS